MENTDTPGEFIENRRFFAALMSASVDYHLIGLVHDCSRKQNQIPPGFASLFNREMIGIITKIDSEKADPAFSRKVLKAAGVKTIFEISSMTGEGLENLKSFLKLPLAAA